MVDININLKRGDEEEGADMLQLIRAWDMGVEPEVDTATAAASAARDVAEELAPLLTKAREVSMLNSKHQLYRRVMQDASDSRVGQQAKRKMEDLANGKLRDAAGELVALQSDETNVAKMLLLRELVATALDE
jgi:hypothetical protein